MFQLYPRTSRTRLIYMNVNYRAKLDPIEELLKEKLSLHVETLKGIDMLLWQAIEQNRFFCL
jgi:shikimate 5-dehydrogenase